MSNDTSSPSVSWLDVTCLGDVAHKEVSWLWKPYIPYGKITILEGDPDAGKTFLSLEIAAHVTTGRSLPSYYGAEAAKSHEPHSVMFLTAEDDLADTIRPRFENANGDPSRFFAINGLLKKENDQEVELGITLSDLRQLEAGMKKYLPGLLIVDPFQAFLGAKVDFHRANEVRPVMAGIGNLAEKYGCAVLLIRHLAKATQNNALYKGIGSIDVTAAARSVLMAGVDPRPVDLSEMVDAQSGILKEVSKTRSVFVHTKCNIAQKGISVAYSIDDGKFVFNGPVDVSAQNLICGEVKREPRKSATQFLLEQLSEGPKSAVHMLTEAGKLDISESTLNRACKDLGIIKRPEGFGKPFIWRLPANASTGDPEALAENISSGPEPEGTLQSLPITNVTNP